MCDCYRIGGPFIAEDPDCPIHGREAVAAREEQERLDAEKEDRIAALEKRIARLEGLLGVGK